jgi:hypothetical protein
VIYIISGGLVAVVYFCLDKGKANVERVATTYSSA